MQSHRNPNGSGLEDDHGTFMVQAAAFRPIALLHLMFATNLKLIKEIDPQDRIFFRNAQFSTLSSVRMFRQGACMGKLVSLFH